MTELTINVEDYLDESEIKEIALDEIRHAMRRSIGTSADLERFIGNSAYVAIWREMDDLAPSVAPELREQLLTRLKEVTPELSTWSVFYRGDHALRNKSSVGAELLDEIVGENRELLEARVREIVGELDEYDIRSALKDRFSEILDGALK